MRNIHSYYTVLEAPQDTYARVATPTSQQHIVGEPLQVNTDEPPHELVTVRNAFLAYEAGKLLNQFGGLRNSPSYYVGEKTLIKEKEGNEALVETLKLNNLNFLGGIVPLEYQSTKALMHPRISHDAAYPLGWSDAFTEALQSNEVVLPGYTVFSKEDARKGFDLLQQQGVVQIRFKDPLEAGGFGQRVVQSREQLEELFNNGFMANNDMVSRYGMVLEENLLPENLCTYSVSLINIGSHEIKGVGIQRGRNGKYAGTDMVITRPTSEVPLEALAEIGVENVSYAQEVLHKGYLFKTFLSKHLPEIQASRFNLDGISGVALRKEGDAMLKVPRCALLEPSFRVGGASAAEILGMRYLLENPTAPYVKASTYYDFEEGLKESYLGEEVLYDGSDPGFGGRLVISAKIHK